MRRTLQSHPGFVPSASFTTSTRAGLTLALHQISLLPPRQRNTVLGLGFVALGLVLLAKA